MQTTSLSATPLQIGRPSRELCCKFKKIQIVSRLEASFSELVLLEVMMLAQTERPLVGGFEAKATVGAVTDVSAFNR